MSQALLQIPAAPSGLDLRIQTNQVFIALLTQNSGPTEPSVTYPGMWWGDTTANRLRRRNNANSAWVDIGPLDDFLGDLRTQIALASSAASAAVPTGTILQFAADYAPSGFFLCNGAWISRSTYSALFTVIGTTYGAGDGSATFTLPDLRGVAVRGKDSGRGIDPNRALGSYQSDAFGWHGHGVTINDPGHAHGVYDPGHRHTQGEGVIMYGGRYNTVDTGIGTQAISSYNGITGVANSTSTVGTGIGIYGNGTGISAGADGAGDSETRMKNVALNFIIKT